MINSWALTDDLSRSVVYGACALLILSLVLLFKEYRQTEGRSLWVLLSGAAACLAFAGAVFRPVEVAFKSSLLGPRVAIVVDRSRRLDLPLNSQGSRADAARGAVSELRKHYGDSRLALSEFSSGSPSPYRPAAAASAVDSDLSAALRDFASSSGERPAAIVVVSDGRLTRPINQAAAASLVEELAAFEVPIHTVGLVPKAPTDASIRAVKAAGAAVAHQPLVVTVEVGCSPDLPCDGVPVTISELLHGETPMRLAAGTVRVSDGVGRAEFEVTLDRAGTRVLEVAISSPPGDTIPENDTRFVTFSVAKERIRLLHLAGRPTYDVRALRTWLKSDESVDVVAFFILRGETDDPGAGERELALIRFPVDELFTEHLPSFDAVILQDIDAIRYKLSRYLPRLENYVKKGGGLIMVGGPSSFGGGNYAGTPLDSILPVEQPRGEHPVDPAEFVPVFTESGMAAPVTHKLRTLLGGQLPSMSGANLLGAARAGAIVLWEHPKISVGGRGMPLLALGEAGDGRSIAMAVDSTHRLAFGQLAASVSGRAYGALWDGLLGWLMRDPRYEAARVEVLGECIANRPTTLRVHRLPGMAGQIHLTVESLSAQGRIVVEKNVTGTATASVDIELNGLAAGGYAAKVVVGAAPATRHDFGCEEGGQAWADSRPNNALLASLSELSGGMHVMADSLMELPKPPLTEVTASRTASPWFPPWLWTLAASLCLGWHWLMRRTSGLS